MATPNIVPRSDSEGGLGTASKYWASAYIDTITTTGDITASGNVSIAEKLIHTGDTDTFLQFGDNDIKLKAGGATYFHAVADQTTILYSGNSIALSFDTSQNATFAGNVDIDGNTLTIGTASHTISYISGTTALRSSGNFEAVGTLRTYSNLLVGGTVTGATSYNGIPFYAAPASASLYTHDVSGTDDSAEANTAYGFNAMVSITTGDNNVAIGYRSGQDLTTGSQNVLLGKDAGKALSTGSQNIAIGNAALSKEDGHGSNVAIGHEALEDLNAGQQSYNVAVGHSVGKQMTTGAWNVLIGGLAGDALTTSSSNVAIGYQALSTEDTTGGVTAVGYQALRNQNASSTSFNTALGYQTGLSVTTGVQNTLIGCLAGDAIT